MNARSHDDAPDAGDDGPPQRKPSGGSGRSGTYGKPKVEGYLKEAMEAIESAPGIPMSASVRVNRDELLDLLDDVVENLPEELRSARWLLKERDEYMARTRREADELGDLGLGLEVAKAAEARARHTNEEAEANARRMRREAEDFCDQRLASFENVLSKVQKSVAMGRRRLAAPTIEESELRGFDDGRTDSPLPSPEDSPVFDQEL